VEVVGKIVKQIHAFSLATDLGLALQTSIIDPTLKAYLPEAIVRARLRCKASGLSALGKAVLGSWKGLSTANHFP